MYEFLVSPITLFCLGIMFVLITLLFFYFKRTVLMLERAQKEQAEILRSFIANMQFEKRMGPHDSLNAPSPFKEQGAIISEQNNLIDVSDDGSESDDESDEESDEESEVDSEKATTIELGGALESFEGTNEYEDLNDSVKVIQLDNLVDQLPVLNNEESDDEEEEEEE